MIIIQNLRDLCEDLYNFIQGYKDFFKAGNRDNIEKGYQYVCGLFQSEKSNIEKMSEQVEDSESQNVNHFISDSPWDHTALINEIGSEVDAIFSTSSLPVCLLIDESGWVKKGDKSVGVSRQYLGSIGKVDNGQVAVFGSLAQGDKVCIINTRLYLPHSWTDDKERCLNAGVPESEIKHRTKPELGLEIVEAAHDNNISYDWIGGDGFYGHDSKFRYALDDQGEFYILDIHCDDTLYLEDPNPYIPERKSNRGRKPSRYQTDIQGVTAKTIAETAHESEWKEYTFRDGTKGPMRRQVLVKDVYTWNGEEATARTERLIISRNPDGTDLKYSLCNDRDHQYSHRDLLYMQMQRYWVERSLQDAKSELGMDEYQVRTWRGWHHHMALTFLALLFMLTQKVNHKEDAPLLSCSDIRFILANTLPKKTNSREQVMKLIQERHQRRKRDMDRYT